MIPTDNIHKLIKKLNVKAGPDLDARVHNDISKALAEPKQIQPAATQPNIWRIIMKNPMTKIATAAAVILIAALGITFLDKSATPAWAIEQTIEAMKKFNGIYLSGTWVMYRESLEEGFDPELVDAFYQEGKISFEMWAQVNEDGTRSGNVKIKGLGGMIGVADEDQTRIYLPKTNTIYIQQGSHIMVSPWPSQDFLAEKEKESEDWKVRYGTDAETGRDRIFVTCRAGGREKSWWFEFDLETKLLVRFKQWTNAHRQGQPECDVQKIIYYEELPDEVFELEAPEDAEVFEGFSPLDLMLVSKNGKLGDPEYGVSVEGLTKDQACEKILKEFWQALIDDDLSRIRQLLPITADWDDEMMINDLGLDDEDDILELLEVGQIVHETKSDLGPVVVVPSIISCKDGKMREIKLIIIFRQLEGESSCVIYANSGAAREIAE